MATIWESTDADASIGTTYALVPGNQFGGGVNVGGDRDWIKVVVNAGYGYSFTIEGDDSRGPQVSSPQIQLRDAEGIAIGTANTSISLNTLAAGTYYLDAGSRYTSYTGNYLIKSAEEVAANLATKASVAVNGSYKGGIDFGGDHDWLKVQLTAGNAYVFRVVSDDSSGAGVSYPRLQLRNIDGTINGSASDVIGFTATSTGGHFLDIYSYYSSYTGNYRVEVVEEVANSATTKAQIAPNGTYRGTIDYQGDKDWVKVSLVKGQTYVFRISGDSSSGDAVSYPYLQVRNADGTTNGDRSSLLSFTATKSGIHYLSADAGSYNTGDYLISSTIDLADNSTTALTFDQFGSTTQVINYSGDKDWIKVKMVTGSTYTIKISGAGSSPLADSKITLRDAKGEVIGTYSKYDTATQTVEYKAVKSGFHFLDISGYYSSSTGGYRVSVSPDMIIRKGTGKSDKISGFAGVDKISGLGGNDVLRGLDGDDFLYGGAGKDTLYGGNGNDFANGGAGDDIIYGGKGADTLLGGGGKDTIYGEAGNDFLVGGGGADKLFGGDGDDILQGGPGNDILNGGKGRDTADYSSFNKRVVIDLGKKSNTHTTKQGGTDTFISIENVTGGSGNDKLSGDKNANTLSGGDGDDVLFGGGGADILIGGNGNDVLDPGNGKGERLIGGAGDDRYMLGTGKGDGIIEDSLGDHDVIDASKSSSAANIDLGTGKSSTSGGQKLTLEAGGTSTLPLDLVFLQDLSGSFGGDIATVRDLAPKIVNAVNKVAPGSGFGAVGFVDKPTSPFGSSYDYVYKLFAAISTGGADAIRDAYSAMTIQSGADGPEAQLEALMQVAKRADGEVGFRPDSMRVVVLFTDADYHVAGDGKAAGINRKNDGDADIEGNGILEDYPSIAMTRKALIDAGIFPIFAVTNDVMGDYRDLVKQLGVGGVVALKNDSTNVVKAITQAAKIATRTSIEDAVGSRFDDHIKGSVVDNVLDGNAGNDILLGLAGNDTLRGGAGNDKLTGGTGKDTLVGGAGADHFIYETLRDSTVKAAGRDKIMDFRADEGDRIDLSAIDAQSKTDRNDAFTFIGTAKFSNKAGELRFEKKGKSTFVYGDVDGDSKADFAIELAGQIDLKQGDFVL